MQIFVILTEMNWKMILIYNELGLFGRITQNLIFSSGVVWNHPGRCQIGSNGSILKTLYSETCL